MLLKRLVSAILACAAVAILAWPQRPPPVPPGRTVITYWEKWAGAEAMQMQQIVDQFNDTVGREKNIYVQFFSMSNVNQKTLAAAAAGVPPDIAGLWDAQLAAFAALGALEPLDDLAAAHGISAKTYKPIYWQGCRYDGRLWALISTPGAVALHYNKRIFYQNAARLRAAGLDPGRPPRTIAELDRYAQVLDVWDDTPTRHLARAGYLPQEPGWYINCTDLWFGGQLFDPTTGKVTLLTAPNIAAYQWMLGYTRRLGKKTMAEFHSSLPHFTSEQNAFLTGEVVMEQQGPWMAHTIAMRKPDMSQALVPFVLEPYLPRVLRPFNYDWAAAPFPSAVPGLEDVTLAGYDVLAIPRGSKHKAEAFEFIAFVNRQDVMEKLCAMHCKNSPLAQVSDHFLRTHPNPYIDLFERLAWSPNAHTLPASPIWPQAADELRTTAERVYLPDADPNAPGIVTGALAESQAWLQDIDDRFMASQKARAAP